MKKLITMMFFYLIGFLLCTVFSQAQQPNQREITIEITNRKLTGSVYTADVVLVLRPNLFWRVDECSFYLNFSTIGLNQTAYIGENLLNVDPELAINYSAYQSIVYKDNNVIPGIVAVELEHIAGRPYAIKQSGSSNLIVRIGTVRWNVNSISGLDGISLVTDRSGPFIPRVQHYDSLLNITSYYTETQIHVPGSPDIPINRGGCSYQFFAPPQTCNVSYQSFTTLTPIPENCPRWPQRVGPGVQPAVAKFQYDFDPAETPRGWQAQEFDYSEIIPILDKARCQWEKQIDSPNLNMFDWEETTTGGRIYFTTNPLLIADAPMARMMLAAIAYEARDPNALSFFKDSSQCGPQMSQENFKKRSEIIFNNCDAFHGTNPHRHWSTNTTGSCLNGFCLDFFSIAQHELGHYIGLDHEIRNPDACMFLWTVWPMPLNLTQCDADNARRLYNPTLINALPDNTSCATATSVEETTTFKLENTLSVYPSPNYGDICTVQYSLNKNALIKISVTDLHGNQVIPTIEKQREAGIYQSAFSTEALQSGAYMVTLQINGEQLTQKFVLVK